ncbi:MAG: glycerol-3-phosphate responsive antiterminator [Lachnospiraceae bacterium]|nr:glycerol-3-phosphate responsive antiterminator [Lachnospiraceae bacterium]
MTVQQKAFADLLLDSPIIAAVKDDEGMERALSSDCQVIFVLYGTILNIHEIIDRAKQQDRLVFIHVDLIEGLSGKEIALDYLKQKTQADGIVSTRIHLIKYARTIGLFAIQRFFLIDSLSFENVKKQAAYADAVDILPGIMPKIIRKLTGQIRKPLIASGLISDKQDMMTALAAGANAVSGTCSDLWFE